MSSVIGKLNGIVQNTQRLLDMCRSLQAENDSLKLETQSLKVALETSQAQVRQLEEKTKALTVARTLDVSAPADGAIDGMINEKKLDTTRKIDDFVREIARCIELLK